MTQNLSKPEPAPQPNGNTHLWSLVIRDMLDRNAAGVAKYGTPLQAGNGRDALMDAYQEALDLCVYLRQAIEERRAMLHVAHHGEVVDDEFDPWQSAVPEQDVQRREQVAHGVGYIIPQMEDGDDDPAVVHIVPDRTSRNATLTPDTVLPLDDDPGGLRVEDLELLYRVPEWMPDECLGAMCGRVRG